MSVEGVIWAMGHLTDVERPTHRLVLVYFGWRASSDPGRWAEVWASKTDICHVTGLDRKTVMHALRVLTGGERPLIEDTGKRAGHTGQIPVYRCVGLRPRGAGT